MKSSSANGFVAKLFISNQSLLQRVALHGRAPFIVISTISVHSRNSRLKLHALYPSVVTLAIAVVKISGC